MDLGFAESKAVVTGGSKGMGLAIAETLAAEGARVAVMARGRAALDAAAETCRAAGAPDAVGISVDMADAALHRGRLRPSRRALGRAQQPGAHHRSGRRLFRGDGRRRVGRRVRARHHVRACAPFALRFRMLRAADWARIVTLSAHSIQRQNPRIVAYTASKAALSSVTKNLSKSLAKDGILVNCVCPGTIVTASFTEKLNDILAAEGLDATDPHRRHDLDREQLPPALRSRPRRASRGDRLDHHLPGVPAKRLCHRRDGERRRGLGLCVNDDGRPEIRPPGYGWSGLPATAEPCVICAGAIYWSNVLHLT